MRDWFAGRAMAVGMSAAGFTPVAALGVALLPGWWRAIPVVAQVVLAVFAFAVPAAKSEKAESRAEAAEEERDSARREMLIFVTDAVRPFLTEVVSQVDPAGTVPQGTASAEGVSTVLAASAKLCADGESSNSRTRACWYRLNRRADGTQVFEPAKHFGRGNKPRTTFDASQPRGRALLDLVRDDRSELWRDLDVEKPQNWQPGATAADYVTFMVVPVRTLASQFGVLMVDATEAGLLTDADVEAVHTLSNVFALALSQDSVMPAEEPGTSARPFDHEASLRVDRSGPCCSDGVSPHRRGRRMPKNRPSPAAQRAKDLRNDPDRYFRDARERADRVVKTERANRSGASSSDSEDN